MGRSSRRAVRHDLLRGTRGATDSGCQQAEGRLSLRRPAGALLPGGCQSTPLSRRSTRRGPRPQEEARRRAEARLASLFRTDASPGRHRGATRSLLGCVGVVDGSDSDVSLNVSGPAGAAAAAVTGRPAASSTAVRPPSQASGGGSTQSGGGECHRCRCDVRPAASGGRSNVRGNSQCRSAAREASPGHSAAEANAATSASQPRSGHRPATSTAASAPGATAGDWTEPRRPVSASFAAPTTPDEGEGLTPGPGGGVRMEDLLDTVLGEVQTQLSHLTAGGELVCDEERDELVALYRRQPRPPPDGDCPLLQRLRGQGDGGGESGGGRGGRGDSGAVRSDSQREGRDTEEEDFVLQVCTSSQEDSTLEQDPIRFLKMVEAANTGASSGSGRLDAARPAHGAPLRQHDLLTARAGVLLRSPSPLPASAAEVGWLEAAVSPGRWPDWRGGGDILDVLDGPHPRWETAHSAASAGRHHRV